MKFVSVLVSYWWVFYLIKDSAKSSPQPDIVSSSSHQTDSISNTDAPAEVPTTPGPDSTGTPHELSESHPSTVVPGLDGMPTIIETDGNASLVLHPLEPRSPMSSTSQQSDLPTSTAIQADFTGSTSKLNTTRTMTRPPNSMDVSREGTETSSESNDTSFETDRAPWPSFIRSALNTMKVKSMVFTSTYCETNYSAREVEELLDMDSPGSLKFIASMGERNTVAYTWRLRYGLPYLEKSPELKCSVPLNSSETPNAIEISRHEFFKSRNILIPIGAGRRGARLNRFLHLNKSPIWRLFLECTCQALDNAAEMPNICVDGKVVNLSRGVGGERSFFVHVPDASGSYYNVIAHICF